MLKLRVSKWLCILLTVSVLAAVPVMPIFSDEVNTSPEILKNADFEAEGLDPWTGFGDYRLSETNAYSGAHCIALSGSEESGIEQLVTGLNPDTTYVLTAWGKVSGKTNNIYMGIKDFGGEDKIEYKIGSSAYVKRAVQFKTGADSTSAAVYVRRAAFAGGAGYVDKMSLETLDEFRKNEEETDTTEDDNANVGTPAGSIDSGPIKNNGFEAGKLTSWNCYGNFELSEESPHSGKYSVKFGGDGKTSGVQQVIKGLYPNTTYTLSAYCKVENRGDKIMLGVTDHGAAQKGYDIEATTYTPMSFKFTTGPSSDSAKIFVYRGEDMGDGAAYADDFSITGPFQEVDDVPNDSIEDANKTPEEKLDENDRLEYILNKLDEKGIITKTGFDSDKQITRAEVLAMIIRTINMEEAAKALAGKTRFDDVPEDYWASGYINLAVRDGIANGTGETVFEPEENVTQEQMIKMMLCAFGHNEEAEADGGYPDGYMKLARDRGYVYGIAAAQAAPITKAQAASICHYAILSDGDRIDSPKPEEIFDIFDSNKIEKYKYLEGTSNKVQVVEKDGAKALKMNFGTEMYPCVKFNMADLGLDTDWSEYSYLAFDITNTSTKTIHFGIRVDSMVTQEDGTDKLSVRQGMHGLGTAERILFCIPLKTPPEGVNSVPIGQSIVDLCANNKVYLAKNATQTINPEKIVEFQIFEAGPIQENEIYIHSISLIKDDKAMDEPYVDRFGQYINSDWRGKLYTHSEFEIRKNEEEAELSANPNPSDWDEYGGYADGPQLDATGHFRVERYGGKWWLVDPNGKLFWSNGITCLTAEQVGTIGGKEKFYEYIPTDSEYMSKFNYLWSDVKKYSYYTANLYRKYGDDYLNQHVENTLKRLRSWGINTAGAWSTDEFTNSGRVPYTAICGFSDPPRFGKIGGSGFVDVFDPRSEKAIEKGVKTIADKKNDPMLVGVFIDNELGFASEEPDNDGVTHTTSIKFTKSALGVDGEKYAIKQKLVEYYTEKYGTIEKLNAAWGTELGSFEELSAPFELTKEQAEKGRADLEEFELMIYERYFEICRNAVKKVMPDVLYLGSRFAGYNDLAVRAAAKYCDVVSFNLYTIRPDDKTAAELALTYDFPVIIGEFHFGTLDSGMRQTGLGSGGNQQDRADRYKEYMNRAIASSWCVGAHWFQYIEQPYLGRDDGESYSIGFVTTTDTPVPQLVKAAREVGEGMYKRRITTKCIKKESKQKE